MARKIPTPVAGDAVCYSASFLRSSCRQVHFTDGHKRGGLLLGGLPHAHGVLVGTLGEIAYVLWDDGDGYAARGTNIGNLIKRADKFLDSDLETSRPNLPHEAASRPI